MFPRFPLSGEVGYIFRNGVKVATGVPTAMTTHVWELRNKVKPVSDQDEAEFRPNAGESLTSVS